jgi:hypothetical protein
MMADEVVALERLLPVDLWIFENRRDAATRDQERKRKPG